MPQTILPTTPAGVLGFVVLVITILFAILAIINIMPRPKPRQKPVKLVEVPMQTPVAIEKSQADEDADTEVLTITK